MMDKTEDSELITLLDAVRGGEALGSAVNWEDWAQTLDRWVEAYPAFGAGRMLRAKTARESRSLSAAERLTEAAVFSTEPGRLFDLLFRAGIEAEIASFARAVEALEPAVEDAMRLRWHPSGTAEPAELVEADTASEVASDVPAVEEQAQGSDVDAGALVEEVEPEEADGDTAPQAEVVVPEPGTLAREVVLGAIERSIEKEIRELSEEDRASEPAAGPPSDREIPSMSPLTPAPEPGEPVDLATLSPLARWAYQRSMATGFVEASEARTPAQVLKAAAQKIEAVMDASTQEEDAGEVEQEGLGQRAALIDLFIRNEPTIGPIRQEDEHRGVKELAKESLVEDASLITETMARIYAGQGQIGRARRAYKLLALKYPEKSVYFAAQSKKLGRKAADD